MGNCKTCKHFIPFSEPLKPRYGLCSKFKTENPGVMMTHEGAAIAAVYHPQTVFDKSNFGAGPQLRVREDFGCVMHKE